jgi:hypothetical protein
MTRLLAVPNVSEGRDPALIAELAAAFDARLLDTHSDPDHNRTVFTLAGEPGRLAEAVLAGAAEAVRLIDVSGHEGVHPRVGAIDVAPIVHLDDATRGAACAEALVLGDMLGEQLGLPVFLYGSLTDHKRTRAEVRRGGRLRPQAPAPERRRRPRRRTPAAGRVQRRARAALDDRGREADRGSDPRGGRRGTAVGQGDRSLARASQRRPGLDQHRGPPRYAGGRCPQRDRPARGAVPG